MRKLSCNKTFLFDIEMALLKAIVRNFLLRRSCSSSPSASDLFSVTISHEQWINFISFNEMHLVLYLHPLNLKEKEVINGNGFECPLNWGSHILKPKTLETARLWDEFDHKPRVDFKFSTEFIGFNWKLSWLKTRKFLYRYRLFFLIPSSFCKDALSNSMHFPSKMRSIGVCLLFDYLEIFHALYYSSLNLRVTLSI